jgi:hypothetical protein
MTASISSRAAWRKSSYSNYNGDCVEVTTLDAAAWHKSTHSNNGGECVEIAGIGPTIAVRDSKDPAGPHLDFTPRAWQAFVTTLRAGG